MTISPESFLVVESSLQKRLQKNWNKIKKRIVTSMLLRFEDDDHKAIEKLISRIKLERALQKDTKYTNLMGVQAMYFGISRATPIKQSKTFMQSKIRGISAKSTKQLGMILKDSSKLVRRKVRQKLADEFANRINVTKAEIVRAFVPELDAAVEAAGSLHLAASLHTSRLATMGHLVESVAQGKKTTIWNASLDSRTCPVCTHLDQRVFSVEIIWQRMEKAIEADTVADLKRLSPWVSQSKAGLASFKEMTTSELHMNGYDSPPAHPLCRCYLDVTEQTMTEIDSSNVIPFGSQRGTGLGTVVKPPKPPKPNISEYPPQKTISAAENWARENVAGVVDYTGLDIEVANDVNTALHEMVIKRGYRKLSRIITTHDKKNTAYASATKYGNDIFLRPRIHKKGLAVREARELSLTSHKRIKLDIKELYKYIEDLRDKLSKEQFDNESMVDKVKELINKKRKELKTAPNAPWFVPGGRSAVENIVIHEYGHSADGRFFLRHAGDALNNPVKLDKLMKNYYKGKEKILGSEKLKAEMFASLSEYATYTVDEGVAESWVSYHSGLKDKIPKIYLQWIERLVKEELVKGGKK